MKGDNIVEHTKEFAVKAKQVLADRRTDAENEAKIRTNEIYVKIPEIKEIDRALSATGLKIYAEALKGKDGLDQRIEKLKEENISLRKYKENLLIKNGFDADYCEEKYSCTKCNDTGYVGIHACECLKREIRKLAYYSSGLGSLLTEQSFENFDLSYYSSQVCEKSKVSPLKNMEYILNSVKKYADEFSGERSGNLLFLGGTGLGKTHLSTALAKSIIDKGYSVVYDTAQNIMQTFEKERFSNRENENYTDKYFSCDLLVIDDLGTEFKTSFSQSVLYNLLNTRICSGKSMLISTNLKDIKALKKDYDERITSRLIGDFSAYMFMGEDIRLLSAKKKNKKK